MKILLYSRSLTRSAGGVFFAVAGLAKALLAQGIDVAVVGGADAFLDEDRDRWGQVPLYPHPLSGKEYGLSLKAIADIRRFGADLIHIHGTWSAASVYGRLAALTGVPLVVSPHGMLDPWIVARRPAVKGVHAALFERPMLRRGHVHALNEIERQATLAFMPSMEGRIFVAPNGVEELAAPASPAGRSGTLYLGRVHSKKQVLELIDAWGAAPALAGERLTIAGWGDPDYEAQVAARAGSLPNVEFVGPLYGEAKDQALRGARNFILPSLSEGLPMAVLEAIQSGCVPVITDQCNLPELFADGIALRMETDFSDFETVMADAVSRPEAEQQRMSMAAAAYASRYLWSNIAASMAEEYHRILSDRM